MGTLSCVTAMIIIISHMHLYNFGKDCVNLDRRLSVYRASNVDPELLLLVLKSDL